MIGKLDRRITFIEPTISNGTSNEDKITAWTAIASIPDVWASFSQQRGSVLVDQDRVSYAQTSTFIIRNRSDLNIRMRVVDENSQVYTLLSVAETPGSRKRYLTLTCNIVDNEFWS